MIDLSRLGAALCLSLGLLSAESVRASDEKQPIPTVDELVKMLQDPDASTRATAARTLAQRGDDARSAVPALMALFDDQNLVADEESGLPTVPLWNVAGEAVGKLGAHSLPKLLPLLQGAEMTRCHAAAVAVHQLGAAGKPAVPVLIEQLERNNPETRIAMIYGLLGIGPEAAPAVPALMKMLDSEDFHTQYWSCRTLGKIGLPAAQPAVPALIRLLKDDVASVRGNAAAALGQLGPQAGPAVVPALTETLGDKLYTVRRSAAEALGKIGPTARSAVPKLDQCLASDTFAARSQAAVARYRITRELEPTVKVLLEELENPNSPWDAAIGFEQIGAPAEAATDRLIKLLSSPQSETRVFAASSLAGIGPNANRALPKLRELLRDKDDDVREVAAEAIEKLGDK